MTNMFEWTDGEIYVVINHQGEKVPLLKEGSITFENLAGSRLRMTSRGRKFTCEAEVPESAESLKWEFEVDPAKVRPLSGCVVTNNASDIESLISEGRVALNGRW